MALPICPSRILGPCAHHRNVFHPDRRAVLRLEHRLLDVLHVGDQPHRPDIHLLRALLDEAAPGIRVALVSCCSICARLSP